MKLRLKNEFKLSYHFTYLDAPVSRPTDIQ